MSANKVFLAEMQDWFCGGGARAHLEIPLKQTVTLSPLPNWSHGNSEAKSGEVEERKCVPRKL